eukprot:6172405-Pyramimonas_sp.AAC.1
MKRQRPRSVRVAVHPKAKRFNQVECTDVYYIMWKKKERKILAIMDEFSRYEADYPIKKKTFRRETKLWGKLWISWAGKPDCMRMGAGGSHTAAKTQKWMSERNIEFDITPKGAHHKLAEGRLTSRTCETRATSQSATK